MELSKIEDLSIDRVLRRGTGEILEEREDAILVRDRVSGIFMLACTDRDSGLALAAPCLDRGCELLMVADPDLGKTVYERYGFSGVLECYQAAYYGEPPVQDPRLSVRVAGAEDLPFLTGVYDLISPEEMAQVVARGSMLLGYDGDRLVGFMGEHLEGSMGMLFILPEYRRRGWASALERRCIARTLAQGFIPFGQVERNNRESLLLQEKLGLIRSEKTTWWMWRGPQ